MAFFLECEKVSVFYEALFFGINCYEVFLFGRNKLIAVAFFFFFEVEKIWGLTIFWGLKQGLFLPIGKAGPDFYHP